MSVAARTVQSLTAAPVTLLQNPRIGEKLGEFDPREVRRILVGRYEMQYEIQASTIYMLRLWHTVYVEPSEGKVLANGDGGGIFSRAIIAPARFRFQMWYALAAPPFFRLSHH